MKYKDTETGAIYEEINLFAEYLENASEIEENSGARYFWEWLRNATGKNGFWEVVDK